MRQIFFTILALSLWAGSVDLASLTKNHEDGGEVLMHFNYKTENGQMRSEDIKYNNTITEEKEKDNDVGKPVEYRGGYSFVSADGYEYSVLYKANKNGFQPYVTARKIKNL